VIFDIALALLLVRYAGVPHRGAGLPLPEGTDVLAGLLQ
jgi:hypothetical protein